MACLASFMAVACINSLDGLDDDQTGERTDKPGDTVQGLVGTEK